MKKFLLLCGVAVITATSVAYAESASVTADFDVKIKLIGWDTSLRKVQDLNFGAALPTNLVQSITVDSDGTVSGDLESYGPFRPAILYAGDVSYKNDANLFDIEISGAEELRTPSVGQEQGKLCGYISNWQHEKFEYASGNYNDMLGFRIGATFTTPDNEDREIRDYSEESDCSATATATLIYTGGVTSGDSSGD